MFIFKHGGRRAVQSFASTSIRGSRYYASKIEIPFTPPPVPVIEACPSPTCPCRETPSGLDIERESNISGSMASYAEQVLICTGRDDWKSKIEDDEDAVLVRQLKGFLTRGGKYQDVCDVKLCNCDTCGRVTDSESIAISQCHDYQQFFHNFDSIAYRK